MRNKLITMEEAVRKYAFDGMNFGNGGAAPVGTDCSAFFREMLRQGIKNINCFSVCNSPGTNLLAAAGCISHLELGFSGLEVYGFANGINRAVLSGKMILEDYSNSSITHRFYAGACGWPFAPTLNIIGSDIESCSASEPDVYPNTSKVRRITDPFTGKTMAAMTSLTPDLGVIHVQMADIYGNCIMLGSEIGRTELSRAAKKLVIQADKIVDTDCIRQFPNLVRIPDLLVDAVVYWPFGCWPGDSTGIYDGDEKHMFYMNKMLKTEEGTEEYIEKYVKPYNTIDEWLDVIGRDNVEVLSNSVTNHLMDPYRKWIKSDSEIQQLMEGR